MNKATKRILFFLTFGIIILINSQVTAFYNQLPFIPSLWNSGWAPGPAFQPYLPPPAPLPPLYGYGYRQWLPPLGFGSQPILSALSLLGLGSYTNFTNPGYPYSIGGYNFATLFASGNSPYPFASPFTEQTYPYLAPSTVAAPPTYTIYTSPLTSTLAPVPTTLATISALTSTFTGGGIGGGGSGFVTTPLI